MLKRKRILITGAAGFLGSHLCDKFIKVDYYVIAMDNLITGKLKNIEHLYYKENFEFINHDVSKHIHISGKLDYILHFASPASPIDYLKIPIQTLKVGSLGTHNCLGLALAKKARILIASTSEVYGDPLVHPQTEEYFGNVNPIGPRGVYDEAKRFQEAITMAYHTYHDLETRIAILMKKAEDDGLEIPYDVTEFIAEAIVGDIRAMEGALVKLLALSSLRREDITMNLAQQVLKNLLGKNSFTDLSIDQIVKYVCREMKVSERQMLGKGRTMEVALARQLAMFLSKELTSASLANIGIHIGGRDHSTVIHACKNIDKKAIADSEFQRKIDSMKSEISGQKLSKTMKGNA